MNPLESLLEVRAKAAKFQHALERQTRKGVDDAWETYIQTARGHMAVHGGRVVQGISWLPPLFSARSTIRYNAGRYLHRQLQDLDAMLDGYSDVGERQKNKMMPLLVRIEFQYDAFLSRVGAAREFAQSYGLGKGGKLDHLEQEGRVVGLLNGEWSSLYEEAESGGDHEAMQKAIGVASTKPLEEKYGAIALREAKGRILDAAERSAQEAERGAKRRSLRRSPWF